MVTARNVQSTLSSPNDCADMFSAAMIRKGYAKVGLVNSTKQIPIQIDNAVEYIYSIVELTSKYIVLLTKHYGKQEQFIDYIKWSENYDLF